MENNEVILTQVNANELLERLHNLEDKLSYLMDKIEPTNRIITRIEAAKFLHITLATLHNWTKIGLVSAHTIGNKVYYKTNDLNNALIKKNQ